jgi:large subunit ribosomal protein L29
VKRTQELSEFRQLSAEQITEKLAGMRRELMSLRFRKSVGRLENAARLRTIRRQIARLSTITRQSKTAEA